jgi:hypothetical protein
MHEAIAAAIDAQRPAARLKASMPIGTFVIRMAQIAEL